jgi:hypothetical protein
VVVAWHEKDGHLHFHNIADLNRVWYDGLKSVIGHVKSGKKKIPPLSMFVTYFVDPLSLV